MELYSIKNNHNSELLELFHSFSKSDEIISRGLVSQDQIVKNAILFIGINPSYKSSTPFKNSINYYNLNQKENAYRTYFRRFEEIATETDHLWTHIDLLYFQETNQKMVHHYLNHSNESRDFLKRQFSITKTVLENTQPKIIVISNALARELFGINGRINLGYSHEFDKNIGTHVILNENSNLYGVPVFFTSMLTGQRALDNGTYERLIWHIKEILKSKSNLLELNE